jgi:hypothetical protein
MVAQTGDHEIVAPVRLAANAAAEISSATIFGLGSLAWVTCLQYFALALDRVQQ